MTAAMRACAIIAVLLVAAQAEAQDTTGDWMDWEALADWDIRGANTMRVERYMSGGNDAASPYPFLGQQAVDEFSYDFSRQVSRYESWRGRATGAINLSDYRSEDRGFVPENLNLTQEKGDAKIPYRLELGDYLGFFSPRTLQLSLKGGLVEVQPVGDAGDPYHSIQFLSGFKDTNYADAEPLEDYYNGISWLVEDTAIGTLGANWVANFRKGDPQLDFQDRVQNVYGVVWAKGFSIWDQDLAIEGEFAQFRGDLATGSGGSNPRMGRAENGAFIQLSGEGDSPLTYRFVYERYGDDFQPNGGAVSANRRALELHGGWRFEGGLHVRTRLQQFTDSLEHATAQVTRTAGVNITGPVPGELIPGLTVGWDTFVQDVENRPRTTNTDNKSTNLNLSAPIGEDWSARLGTAWQFAHDAVADKQTVRRQFTLDLDTGIDFLGFEGSFSPGGVLRINSGGTSRVREYGPRGALSLRGGNHSLALDYSFLVQNRMDQNNSDIRTHNAAMRYGYRVDNHTFGFDGDYQDRIPNGVSATRSYRIGVTWTVEFAKPRRVPETAAVPALAPLQQMPLEGPADLYLLAPGTPMAEIGTFLAGAGIAGGVAQAGLVVYEATLLEEIDERQRLVLVPKNGDLATSALIVEFTDSTDPAATTRAFEKVQEALLKRYGPPSFNFERGDFTANLVDDVNTDRLIRITEWATDDGTIRLGIPRRLDLQVRMEVQHARNFPSPGDTRWSIERVR